MKFNLQGNFTFSNDVTTIKKDIEKAISETVQNLLKKDIKSDNKYPCCRSKNRVEQNIKSVF